MPGNYLRKENFINSPNAQTLFFGGPSGVSLSQETLARAKTVLASATFSWGNSSGR